LNDLHLMEMHITFPRGKRVDATFDHYVVHTDQPRSVGGDDSGPSPYELFLASIATCVGYYVLAYCDARKISTDGIEVIQRAIYGGDGKAVTDLELDIHLPANFPENHRAGVIRAAESCKVKKALANPPHVTVNAIVEADPALEISA
jgi:ribosomal protein S12 methylthiotransferase accessory factor